MSAVGTRGSVGYEDRRTLASRTTVHRGAVKARSQAPLPVLQPTFSIPLTPYHTARLPGSNPGAPDAKVSSAGQLSLSLRGVRKASRRSGVRTEAVVRGVEDRLTRWLGNPYNSHTLRLNVTRKDPAAHATLAAPPPTDLDFPSHAFHDSDVPSSLSDIQSIDGA